VDLCEYNPTARWWYCTIICNVDIPVGQTRVFTYNVVPVLLQSNSPKPAMGDLKLFYQSTKGKDYSGIYKGGPKIQGGSLEAEYQNALMTANYLIVTNPSRMLYYHKDADIQELLSTMARLAMAKSGSLGYLDVNSAPAFDKLIVPQGTWAKKLSPSFSKVGQGYLLIVGETELVPSWHEYGFDIEWNNAADTKDVPFADHYYSDTTGDGAPDLVVGRVIGNKLTDLTATINRSLGIHLGQTNPGYDRSHVLLVSGTGYKQDTFVNDVISWEKTLSGLGWKTSELHFKWYSTHDQKAIAFNQTIPNMDLIVYSGHGHIDEWDDIQCGLTGNPSFWRNPNDFPLDFGNAVPVVIGLACSTGNYEAIDDYNIAEAFLNSGAAVYIGSTQTSSIQQDSKAGNHLFTNWDTSESIGKAFLETERSRWSSDKYGRLLVWEYNIYGDPKFGAIPSVSAPGPEKPTIYRDVRIQIPQYTITESDGVDHVEIPDAWFWMEEGEPLVPYFVQVYSCPADVVVQEVRLLEKSLPTNLTGLSLPVTVNDNRSGLRDIGSPSTGGGWYPGPDFTWTELENPDGTSDLVILVFPFQYDPSSGEARFHGIFDFFVNFTSSLVKVELDTAALSYDPGDLVKVDISLDNPGTGLDVTIDASIRRYNSGEFVAGLLLEDLDDLEGSAAFSTYWSPGDESGHYYAQVEVRNELGRVLDRKTADFIVGGTSCEVTDFVAVLDGDTLEGVSMTIDNTGTVEVSGTGIFVVMDFDGMIISQINQAFSNLSPDQQLRLDGYLSEPIPGISSILMYAQYDGRCSDPLVFSAIGEFGIALLPMLWISGWVIRRITTHK
ncbi:MAG: hypothetical protein HXS50_00610, partial [Theionarchaea archaeon]|nr:hypothetical protein [Theionarchaea archaeon]